MTYLKPFLLLCAISMLTACKKDKEEIVLPSLYTEEVQVLGNEHIYASAIVSDAGTGTVSARGFCWSVNPQPTLSAGAVKNVGEGIGSFDMDIDNLQNGTVYYLRAFATNEAGTAYSNEIQFETENLKSIDYFGATIYVHPTDIQPYFVWGPPDMWLGATSPGYGSGNTQIISSYETPSAAKKCSELVAFNHQDWYLPAIDELEAVYNERDYIGNFGEGVYWSSTEADTSNAKAVDFVTGELILMDKYSQQRCRCIRKE